MLKALIFGLIFTITAVGIYSFISLLASLLTKLEEKRGKVIANIVFLFIIFSVSVLLYYILGVKFSINGIIK